MSITSEYKISELLHESSNSLVYRGYRRADEQPVVVKLLKEDYPTVEKIAWFRREYEITSQLTLPGVVKAYGLKKEQNRWMMLLEDFGGESLHHLGLAGQLSLPDFLKLAIDITEILGQIHQRYVIHKDINPSNIVFNPTTRQVKIIDFGIATMLSRENPTFRNPNALEGTLAYVSPEQTGRMNRSIDYRTDFYSLGVTLYELLTGELPFSTKDALTLVHCHIAQQPVPLQEVITDIPQPIAAIISKLMAKNADDRYQSASGLKADLVECLQRWQVEPHFKLFPLGQQDAGDRFQVPQNLYGREQEIKLLLAAFERVAGMNVQLPGETANLQRQEREEKHQTQIVKSKAEMLLVSGYSGIGKSALIHEVYKPLTRLRGYFIAGKCDQLKRDIPYAPLIQAFRSLIQQILTETSFEINHWREKLLAALGSNSQVILAVIPELALLIGPQPELPLLAPIEARNRFNVTFENFIQVFAQPEHPLVIFLDDLQWTDGATLNLLQLLMTTVDNPCLLVIGAYRDSEVNATHPLMSMLDEIQKANTIVNHISLQPLGISDITQFISHTFHRDVEMVKPMAELVLAKTGGNPFFMNEFLKALYLEELVTFDRQQGVWNWDLDHIQTRTMTDNVVELLTANMQQLPKATQTVLGLAACIGNQFDLQTLSLICEKQPKATAIDLWPAIADGLLLPLSDSYKLLDQEVEGLAESVIVTYRFAHDRIQHAVYSLIPKEDKPLIHRRIGNLLLQKSTSETRKEQIFAIVNQLNMAQPLIEEQIERDELARLNLLAGQKAKESIAYQPAFNYLQVGIKLLGENNWQRQYNLSLELYEETSEIAYLTTDFEEMARSTATVLKHARLPLDEMKVYEVQIQALTAQGKLQDAISTALHALNLLGITFPAQPHQEDIGIAIQAVQTALGERGPTTLIDLPEMTDPEKLAAMRIFMAVYNASYANPILFSLMTCTEVLLSLRYGNCAESTMAYSCYGMILTSAMNNIDDGYEFGQLALDLIEQLNTKKYATMTKTLIYFFLRHGKEHLRKTLRPLQMAYQAGREVGNIDGTTGALVSYGVNAYLANEDLTLLEQNLTLYHQTISQLRQTLYLGWFEPFLQTVLNWRGKYRVKPWVLIGDIYDEQISPGKDNPSACFNRHFNKLILCYRFGEFRQAIEETNLAQEYVMLVATGTPLELTYSLYDSLTQLALFPELTQPEQEQILRTVASNQAKMKLWAQHAPMNYLHKFYLVEAERARVLGHDSEARNYYDQAIDLAIENEYLNEEALAYELAGRFYLDRGQTRLAHQYLRDAHYAYQRWGASAKVKDLEQRYPQLLLHTSSSTARNGITTTTTSTGQTAALLDLTSVLKASQAISGEIQLAKLLEKLMKVVIENAGAQRGFLLLEHKGQWLMEAEGVLETGEAKQAPTVTALQAEPVSESDRLSVAIVNYVARTRENVVLDDATQAGLFTQDAYIRRTQPKSVLCAPLLNQGKLTGILYLENNLTTGAFTPDRLEVLNLLSAQAAISIENARLYNNLTVSEQRFRTLFENAPLGVFEIDLGSTVPLILAANRQAERVYGWSAAEFATMPAEQLAPPEAAPQLRQMISSVQLGKTVTLETTSLRRNGTHFPARISATPQSGAGLNRLIITVEDITFEKQRQAEMEAIEGERRRIAHEIHDGIAQDLVALRFKTTLWHDLVDKNPAHMHAELEQMTDILNGSIQEVRRSIFALRPIALDELGFFPALRQFSSNFGEQYQLQIRLAVLGPEEKLAAPLELPLFRVVQEALNNIRKHAQAHTVQIRLDLAQAVTLTIQDDGKGFAPATLKRSFREGHVGLKQMEERIKGLNGAFFVHSQPGQGTTIEVVLPNRA